MKRSLLYVLVLIASLITLKAQVILQPEWISPVGYVTSVSSDKTKLLSSDKLGYTYTDLKEKTSFTVMFEEDKFHHSITMSDNGKYIVLLMNTYSERAMKVWNLENGKVSNTRKIMVDTDYDWRSKVLVGNNFVVMSSGNKVSVYDLANGARIKTLYDKTNNNVKVKLSPQKNFLMITESDTMIQLWDTGTWALHGSVKRDVGGFLFANFSSNDTKLITAEEYPQRPKIWDLATMKQIVTINGEMFLLRDANFSESGNFVATLSDNMVNVWNANDGLHLKSFEKDTSYYKVKEVFFNKNGDRIFTNREDGVISVLGLESGNKINELRLNILLHFEDNPSVIGDTIITAQMGSFQTNVWEVNDKGFTIVDSIIGYSEMLHADFSDNDKYLRLFTRFFHSWDVKSKKKLPLTMNMEINGELLNKEGAMAVFRMQSKIELWNVEEMRKILELPYKEERNIPRVLISQNGNVVFINQPDYDSLINTIKIYDVNKKEYITDYKDSIILTQFSSYSAINPNGSKILSREYSNSGKTLLKVINVSNTKETLEIFSDTNYIQQVFFTRDGKYIVISDSKRFVYILDAETYQLLHTVDNGLSTIGWRESLKAIGSKSGDFLVVYGLEHRADVWSLKSFQKIVSLLHPMNVKDIQFNKNEDEIATACSDNNAYIWDIVSGNKKYILKGSGDTLISVRYSNNEKKIVATCLRGPALLWDLTQTAVPSEYQSEDAFFTISPNPTDNDVTIHLQRPSHTSTPYSVISAVGGKILTGMIPEATQIFAVPLHTLPAGMYIFSVEVNGKKVNEKVLIQ